MSEPVFKAPRPLSEIQTEYGQVVQRAGQCQYQIVALGKDLEMFNNALRDLNSEAFASNEAATKAAEAAKASEAPKSEEQGATS